MNKDKQKYDIGYAIDFNDLSQENKDLAVYSMYIDFSFADPVDNGQTIVCPCQPVGKDAVGLPVVFFKGLAGDDMDIEHVVSADVVAQVDGEIQINYDGLPYVMSVYNAAVLQ